MFECNAYEHVTVTWQVYVLFIRSPLSLSSRHVSLYLNAAFDAMAHVCSSFPPSNHHLQQQQWTNVLLMLIRRTNVSNMGGLMNMNETCAHHSGTYISHEVTIDVRWVNVRCALWWAFTDACSVSHSHCPWWVTNVMLMFMHGIRWHSTNDHPETQHIISQWQWDSNVSQL